MITKKLVFFTIMLLYITPIFLQYQYTEDNTIQGIFLGLPIMQTGDEPHYYITLYSLVNDRDIFLTNNYNNALYNEGNDLGTKNWDYYNRHTQLFNSVNNSVINFPFINETHNDLQYIPQEHSKIKEISSHSMGLPFFAFLFLWPVNNTPFLEHAAILFTAIISFFGIYAFYKLLLFYHQEEKKALLYLFIFTCATQYWHYTKTFWTEPYLVNLLIISWYLVVAKKTVWTSLLSGFLLGVGFLMKYPFLLIIFAVYFFFLSQKRFKEGLFFSIPLMFCVISTLLLNYYLTGNFFEFNQAEAVQFVFPLNGLIQWVINPVFGLFTFSPILFFSFFGIKNFWQKYSIQTLYLLGAIVPYFLFWAAYIVSQTGGGGYSARYLVPLIPFFVILCSFSDAEKSPNIFIRWTFYTLIAFSFMINFLAAFAYPAFTGYPLLLSLKKIIFFLLSSSF